MAISQIPDRPDKSKFGFHVNLYKGDDRKYFQPNQKGFYSLRTDLDGLRLVANSKNLNAELFELQPYTPERNMIRVLRFGNDNSCKVLFTGGIHAREWIAVEICYLVAEYLIKNYPGPNDNDPSGAQMFIKTLLDSRQIFVAPLLNPDGNFYTAHSEGDRLWRQNRRPLSRNAFMEKPFKIDQSGVCTYKAKQYNNPNNTKSIKRTFDTSKDYVGVDLNRNFHSTKWGYECYEGTTLRSSSDPGDDDTYFGPHEASEPETKAMEAFILRHKFQCAVDYHTPFNKILYPDKAKADKKVRYIAEKLLHQAIRPLHYKNKNPVNPPAYGPYSTTAYPSFGSISEFLYRKNKTPAFTIELEGSDTSETGFKHNDEKIQLVFERHIRGALAAIKSAGQPVPGADAPPEWLEELRVWKVAKRGNQLPLNQ